MENLNVKIFKYIDDFERAFLDEASLLQNKTMPKLTEEDFQLYEKTGNRLVYEEQYFERRRFLTVFGIVCIWDKKYIKKLEQVILDICNEKTWALPAHVDTANPGYLNTIDLFSAETGQTLANILKELGSNFSADTRKIIFDNLEERLINEYIDAKSGSLRWEHFANNWISVCAGSLADIAMNIYDKGDLKQSHVLQKAISIMPEYLKSFCSDGTCLEGLAYYSYGLSYYLGFVRKVFEHTDGQTDFLHNRLMQNIAKFQSLCYLNEDVTVSFSDSNTHDKFRMGITLYMASLYKSTDLPPLECVMDATKDHCHRYWTAYQDYVWTKEYVNLCHSVTAQKPREEFRVLCEAQWAILKTECVGLAVKGGNNDEPHNHNDVGNLIYAVEGEIFLADIGWGEYTKDYFPDETRYKYLTNRSKGHNVPVINGQEQKNGANYKADRFVLNEDGSVEISFAGAYKVASLCSLTRTISYNNKKIELNIKDRAIFSGDGENKFSENFIAFYEPTIISNYIILKGKKGACEIHITNSAKIECTKKEYVDHSGNISFVWAIVCEIAINDKSIDCEVKVKYFKCEGVKHETV